MNTPDEVFGITKLFVKVGLRLELELTLARVGVDGESFKFNATGVMKREFNGGR